MPRQIIILETNPADGVLASVSGDQSEALIIYKDTGAEGTSPLIAYIDTVTGLPVNPTAPTSRSLGTTGRTRSLSYSEQQWCGAMNFHCGVLD
jgi:hypothetical protein